MKSLGLALVISGFSFAGISYATEGGQEMQAVVKAMCEQVNTIEMSEDVNKDFAKIMIPHHQSAVALAEAYLKEGNDPTITAMAQKMIEDQKKEIEALQTWLEGQGSEGSTEESAAN